MLLGLGILVNFRSYPRLYFDALRKTYSEMGDHWWSRISRESMVPSQLPFVWFRLLGGGVLIFAGVIALIQVA
jgi:hypothetical protein